MIPFKDLTNQIFGRLTVQTRNGADAHGRKLWLCVCVCGKTKVIPSDRLLSGNTKSCGCSHIEHGHTMSGEKVSREFAAWCSMLNRCYRKTDVCFHRYGKRGITVCIRWRKSFKNFLTDMGLRPSSKHSLDRINNNKNYNKKNCRWATAKEQQRNRNNNKYIYFNGKLKTMIEWSELTGIKYYNIRNRLQRGWDVKRALTTKG